MAKLGPVYKGDAGKVAAMLAKVPAQEVADAMEKDGSFMAGNYQVFPEQVEISKQKTVVRGTRFVPHVVEPSFGSDRLFYVALEYAYNVKDDRVILSFPRSIAPIQVGVYPLMGKDGLDTKAKEVQKLLSLRRFHDGIRRNRLNRQTVRKSRRSRCTTWNNYRLRYLKRCNSYHT